MGLFCTLKFNIMGCLNLVKVLKMGFLLTFQVIRDNFKDNDPM